MTQKYVYEPKTTITQIRRVGGKLVEEATEQNPVEVLEFEVPNKQERVIIGEDGWPYEVELLPENIGVIEFLENCRFVERTGIKGEPESSKGAEDGAAEDGVPQVQDSPVVRRAEELGVDISQVDGSGDGGTVTLEDVEQHEGSGEDN